MPVFKRTPTMGVSVRMVKQEDSATTVIPEAPKYDPTVRPVDPFSNTLLNQHDSGLRVRMHRAPRRVVDEKVPTQVGALWVQSNHEDNPSGYLWPMDGKPEPTTEGPFFKNMRDIEWWSAQLTSWHPNNIHGGQEYVRWRCLENLRCFSRKDPYTGEVYAGILDYWIAYDDEGNKAYIKHPFRWLAEWKYFGSEKTGGRAGIPGGTPRTEDDYILPPDYYEFEATTDPNVRGQVVSIHEVEFSGAKTPGTLYEHLDESITFYYPETQGYQVFDISDDGRKCVIGFYATSFFMSYGARPVQEITGVVEFLFDFSVVNGRVTDFTVTPNPKRFVYVDNEWHNPVTGVLPDFGLWGYMTSSVEGAAPIGGLDIGVPVAENVGSWNNMIQYVGSFYHEGELRDIVMYVYQEYPLEGDVSERALLVIDYGGLYNVYEEFLTSWGPWSNKVPGENWPWQVEFPDVYEGGEGHGIEVVGHLLKPFEFRDRANGMFEWGWSWDMNCIIYGDYWWAEGGFDIHGSCRCCSVQMYIGPWWNDALWDATNEPHGYGADQVLNRSAFLTPDGLVGESSVLGAGFANYSGPGINAGCGYPGWMTYSSLPDKATWNPITKQVAGSSCLPLAWKGTWSENWVEHPEASKELYISMDAVPVGVDCDYWWAFNFDPRSFYPEYIRVYGGC